MEYSKLPAQPPAYTAQPAPPNGGPAAFASAPPSEAPHYPMVPPAPQPQMTPNVTVVNTTIVDNGQGMICPKCNARIRMRVEHHATGSTYCLAAILCLFLWVYVCSKCWVRWNLTLFICIFPRLHTQMLAMRLCALLLQLLLQDQPVLPQLQRLPGQLLRATEANCNYFNGSHSCYVKDINWLCIHKDTHKSKESSEHFKKTTLRVSGKPKTTTEPHLT